MDIQQTRNPKYTTRYVESSNQMTIEFQPDFDLGDWEEFSTFSRTKLEEGVKDWYFDLRRIQIVKSLLLGGIIGFNMVVQNRKGHLSLMVEKDSRIAELIYMSKVDRIVTVRELRSNNR